MERFITDLFAIYVRARPWFLRAAALLRIAALAVWGRLLLGGGGVGIAIGVWLVVCAVGLWWRRTLLWRLALLGDIAVVIGGAVKLLDAGDLQLFAYIAGAAAIEVVLLSLGQPALDPGAPVPQ
jgi:hypothetical protein